MNTSAIFKLIRMWGIGAALFALRLYQNAKDFDSETGLHTLSPAGIAIIAIVAGAIAAAFIFSRRESKTKPHFSEHFSAPERSTMVMIVGSFLLAAGGGLLVMNAFRADVFSGGAAAADVASLVVGALVIVSFFFFLLLTRQMRRGEEVSLILLLPPMFFAAFWVLSLYLPAANDPVLARYCLPIIAAAAAAYAFAQLAGFFRCETRVRNFSFIAECAVILCVGAAAELNVHSLLYAGCALILTVFFVLQSPKKQAK